jgi:hypothetical protein
MYVYTYIHTYKYIHIFIYTNISIYRYFKEFVEVEGEKDLDVNHLSALRRLQLKSGSAVPSRNDLLRKSRRFLKRSSGMFCGLGQDLFSYVYIHIYICLYICIFIYM